MTTATTGSRSPRSRWNKSNEPIRDHSGIPRELRYWFCRYVRSLERAVRSMVRGIYQERVLVGFTHPIGSVPNATDRVWLWAMNLRGIKGRAWVAKTTFLGLSAACEKALGEMPLISPDTMGAETTNPSAVTNAFVSMVRSSQDHAEGVTRTVAPEPVDATLWAHIFVPEDRLMDLRKALIEQGN